MNNELVELVNPAVEQAARSAAFRWNNLLPADDIEQELWLFILESPAVQGYLRESDEGLRLTALKRKADSICSKERLDYDHFTGNFTYTPADVQRILPNIPDDSESFDAETVDATEALKILERENPLYHTSLVDALILGVPCDNRKRKERAVDKLADIMNRKRSQREADYTEGPGTAPATTTNPEEVY